ncbi:hypothetical protein ACQQ2N_17755 [Dokdonella sp. MW10]|uniref:hypothetical protein n=1 Tax=Dokdonella sp. MW10 TaxID=2992926 RepID=UPI003F81BBDA
MFLAGLVLVVAGVLSSSAELWHKEMEERRALDIDVGDATSIDIGSSRVDEIRFVENPGAVLSFTDAQAASGLERATWQVSDKVLHVSTDMPYGYVDNASLKIGPGLQNVTGQMLRIISDIAVSRLRLDAWSLTWSGDAEALDIHVGPMTSRYCDGVSDLDAHVHFVTGKVGVLRIAMVGGKVMLGDLSEVGEIELRVRPSVQLELASIADLPRIRLLPFDGEQDTLAKDDASTSACTQRPGAR